MLRAATSSSRPSRPREMVNLDDAEFAIARSRADLTAAFELLHRSYVRAGLEQPRPSGVRITPYHFLPSTEVFVTKLRGEVISTLTLVSDGLLGLPMESMYADEIEQVRGQGMRVAEVGCLADRRNSPIRFFETFVKMTRLLARYAMTQGIHGFVAATHPRHARFYVKTLGFRQIGEVTECPYAAGNPATPLLLIFADLERHRGTPLYDRYFGQPFAPEQLLPHEWDNETRRHFERLLQQDSLRAACTTR